MLCHIQLETSHEVKPSRTADQRNLRSQGKNKLGSRKYLEKRKDYDFKTNARRSGRVEINRGFWKNKMTRCFTTSVHGSITTQAGVSVKAGRLMRLSISSSSLLYSSCLYYVFTLNFGFTLLIISEEQHQEDLHLQ